MSKGDGEEARPGPIFILGYTHVKPHTHLSSHADCGFWPWGIGPKVSPHRD